MKRVTAGLIVGLLGAFIAFTPSAKAVTYIGSLDSSSGGGLTTIVPWADGNITFSWEVEFNGGTGLWTYDYAFTSTTKRISHLIIEVSDGNDPFTGDNILVGTTEPNDLGVVSPGSSNPNMPGSMRGIKFDSLEGENLTLNYTIVSDRSPMWGDVYGKGGRSAGGGSDFLYFFNDGFSAEDPLDAPSNGSVDFHVLVPDTLEGPPPPPLVPEPSSLMLMGSGLLALIRFGKRKRK